MPAPVPTQRTTPQYGEIAISASVRGRLWRDLGLLYHWIRAHGMQLIPAHAPRVVWSDGTTDVHYRVEPSGHAIARVWIITLRLDAVLIEFPFNAHVDVTFPDGETRRGVASHRFAAGGDSFPPLVYIEPLSSKSAQMESLDLTFEVITADDDANPVSIDSLACYELPRAALTIGGASDAGIELESLRAGQPMYDDGHLDQRSLAAVASALTRTECRRSLVQQSFTAQAFTSGTATDLFALEVPVCPRKIAPTDTTHVCRWAVYARVSAGGTTGTIRINTGSSRTASVAVSSTSFGWLEGEIELDSEDLSTDDGMPVSGDETIQITVERDAGVGTVEISAVAVWEPRTVWLPLDLPATLWLRGDEHDSVDAVSADEMSWRNDGSAGGSLTCALTGRAPTVGSIDGRSAVELDGTDDVLVSTLTLADIIAADRFWVAGVIRADALTVAFSVLAPDTGHGILHAFDGSWGIMACTDGLYVYADTGSELLSTSRVAISTGVAVYFEAQFDPATSEVTIRVDDGSPSTAFDPGSLPALTSQIRVGNGGSAAAFDHAIGELVAAQAIPGADDLAEWRSYVAARWGVTTP